MHWNKDNFPPRPTIEALIEEKKKKIRYASTVVAMHSGKDMEKAAGFNRYA